MTPLSAEAATLAALLRGETDPAADRDRIVTLARQHGVHSLLYQRLSTEPAPWAAALADRLRDPARDQGIRDLMQCQEDQRVLAALAQAGAAVLVLKGAALAHSHYPGSHLRPRDDTDLLIRDRDRAGVDAALRALGYRQSTVIDGEYVMHQRGYHRDDQGGGYLYDVHWRISNPLVFSDRFGFDELWQRSLPLPLPALGESARCPGPVDALVYACLHRVAHHHDSDRLIWLYDIHLLVQSLTAAQTTGIVALAQEKQLAAITARGIAAARAAFGTALDQDLKDFVARWSAPSREPGSEFLGGGRRRWALVLSDLRALPGWRPRLAYLRENLFPSPRYLLQRHGRQQPAWLPWLYLRRAALGLWRLLRRSA